MLPTCFKYLYAIVMFATRKKPLVFASAPYVYTSESCTEYWNHTVSKLLLPWKRGIQRSLLNQAGLTQFLGHTPLHLLVQRDKLYCIQHVATRKKLRVKKYRAHHYINRINRIINV